MKAFLLLLLTSLLFSCKSSLTSIESKEHAPTHKVSYGAGGKIIYSETNSKELTKSPINNDTSALKTQFENEIVSQENISKEKNEKKAQVNSVKNFEMVPKYLAKRTLKTSKASTRNKKGKKEKDSITNAAFVFGVLSVVLGWIPVVGLVFILPGFILSLIALKKGKNKKKLKLPWRLV